MKHIEMVCVTENNNNKFYRLTENGDGTWTAVWGRVGASENTMKYPMEQWHKKYNEKLKKGYQDITSLKSTSVIKGFKDVTNPEFQTLLNTLQRYSKQNIIDNYTVTADAVTQAQIDRAQQIINNVVPMLTPQRFDRKTIDKSFTDLYTVLPRKMKDVRLHILNGDGDITKAKWIVSHEQELIDNMSSQVQLNVTSTGEQKTLEEALGIKLGAVDGKGIDHIRALLGPNARQFQRAYVVTNINTQKRFEEYKNTRAKSPASRLLWHGSRNENWLSIVSKGLMIRPSNAVITGAMFGYGIYYADKAQKSIGYSSLSGSYWASGRDNTAFLALYDVNTGIELKADKHESWMYTLDERALNSKGKYDSLFAKGGIDLRNNEYIIYNAAQCTVKYLVEIGN
jgi:poly [ADP-ribose] polymerase